MTEDQDRPFGDGRAGLRLLGFFVLTTIVGAIAFRFGASRDPAPSVARRAADAATDATEDLARTAADASLAITVTDADGAPAAGALVRLVSVEDATLLEEARADELGRVLPDAPARAYGALASSGDAAAFVPVVAPPGTAEIRLGHGAPLLVRVVDRNGIAMAGVPVMALLPAQDGESRPCDRAWSHLRDGREIPSHAPALSVLSGADGVADFGVLPRGTDGDSVRLAVDVSPWACEIRWVPDRAREVVLVVRHGLTVRGRLLRPDLSPMSGATVRDGDSGAETRADVDGRFRISGVPAKGGSMIIEPSEPMRWYEPPRTLDRPSRPGGELDLGDVVVGDGLHVAGSVRHADGAPAAGAEVTFVAVSGPDPYVARRTYTDTDGRFESPALSNAPHRIDAHAELRADRHGSRYVCAAPVTVLPGGSAELRIDRVVPELRLRVELPDGSIARAPEVSTRWGLVEVGATLEDGVAVLPLRGDPPWSVHVFAPGHEPVEVEIAEAGGDVVGRTCVLRATRD